MMHNNSTLQFAKETGIELARASCACCRLSCYLSVILVALLCFTPLSASDDSTSQFRIGFSSTILVEVNENDAIAAMRVWSQAVAHESAIPVDPKPIIFHDISEITEALTKKTIDCINLTTIEYAAIRGFVSKDSIVTGVVSGSIMDEYLLIVHRTSGMKSMSDLQGRKLGLLRTARASFAPVWLETLLGREGLPSSSDFFGQIALATKIGKVVLPVFFHQLDACVTTRNSFETMVTLNPQIGKQLKVLATSPPVVPTIFCFRDDYSAPLKSRLMRELKRCHISPAGQQILTIFQTDRLEEHPVSCLDSALELLAYQKASSVSKASSETIGE